MPLIPDAVIDEVQSRADIAEVIGRTVTLKRAGRHFKALCPFHREKTPSFHVNTDKQIFHCFGCGVGGNVFSFLMQQDRMTFPEAVRQLAEHVGVAIPEADASPARAETAKLAAVVEKAAAYFERLLAHPRQGRAAQAYLAKRGVPEAARRAFRLGFAPPGWRQLLQASQASGVSAESLEAAGLIIRGTAGPYDRFRNRLIFPIQDARGRVVGFGGRSLDAQEPKYLNSPETLLYTKGRHLFGLAQAKEAIGRLRTAVVVEGYFDCVVLASGGTTHVVSPLGTALTAEQARLLKRHADAVILAFDADAAGEAATLRGVDLLVESGLDVRVAKLPQRVDPDEYLQKHGKATLEALLASAQGIFEFLVEQALRRFPGRSTEAKVHAAQFVLPTLARVSNAMLRTEYVRALADRLGLDEASVAQELAKARPRSLGGDGPAGGGRRTAPVARSALAGSGPERLLTALVLDDPARWAQAAGQISPEDVTDETLRHILAAATGPSSGGRQPTAAQIISRLQADGHGAVVAELVELARSIDDKAQALADGVRRVADLSRRRRMDVLRNRIEEAQSHGREETVEQLLVEYQAQVKGG